MKLRLALSLVLTFALALAPGAMASTFGIGARVVPHTDPGSTSTDKNGCPVFHQMGAAPVPELSAGPGEHCESLPTSLVTKTITADGRCLQNEWIQIRLPKNVVDYTAVWYSSIGLGTRWWNGGATLGPDSVTGEGDSYPVPKGYGAWSAAGGAGPAGSCSVPPGTYGVAGWGVTGQHKISGKVTVGSSGQGAANIAINANCPGGGNTTTDENGDYAYLVDANTTCTVAPQLKKGLKSTPTQRVVTVHRSDVNHVDFQVPCEAVIATSHATRARAAAGGGGCPLKVFLKILGPIPNVGTRSGLTVDNLTAADGDVNFTTKSDAGQQCLSGCANLLVKVIDPRNGQVVPNAAVTVDLLKIDTQDAPALHQQGDQFLCTQVDAPAKPDCGDQVAGTTDQNGEFQLLYWAPGEIVRAKTYLVARAHTSCTSSGCPLGGPRAGRTKPVPLFVKPYEIFHHSGELDAETARDLVKAVRTRGWFTIASEVLKTNVENIEKSLAAVEAVSEKEVEAIEGPYGWAFSVAIDAVNIRFELKEEAELRDKFLLDAAGLSPLGLQSNGFDQVYNPGDVSHFDQLLLTGTWGLIHSPSGWLWKLAQELARRYAGKTLSEGVVKPEELHLTAYEVSHCRQGNPDCGPGYENSRGIKPELCFHLDWSTLDDFECLTGYNPPIWIPSQSAVNGGKGLDTSLP